MSTRTPPRSLFRGLVDDAAVFPPGNAPVARAWEEHLRLRRGGYADLLGPLLVGTGHGAELGQVAGGDGDEAPVEVAVVSRPGADVDDLLATVKLLRGVAAVRVGSVETALDLAGSWRRALSLGVPVAVEVDRDQDRLAKALDEVRTAATDLPGTVLAKLRTQETPQQPVPSPSELAAFLLGADARELPVKLTGGLHHAVARRGEDTDRLVDVVVGLDEPAVVRVRSRFRSFGCCGVTDPLDELRDLGLLTDRP